MRHRARSRKLGRTSAHRKAMYRNLVTSLLEHERVETTDAKAKEVRRVAERMITLGKRGDLHARRRAMTVIRRREVAAKVFDDLAERYRDRAGGYTRVLKLGHRVGDSAAISVVELVDREPEKAPVEEKKAKRGKARATETAGKKKATSRKSGAAADSEKKPRARKATSKKAASVKAPSKKDAAAKAPARRKSTRRKSD